MPGKGKTIQLGELAAAVARWLPSSPPRPLPDWLTSEEAAIYLRVKGRKPNLTINEYRLSGRLRGHRVGRRYLYAVEDLDAFVLRQPTDERKAVAS